MFFITFILAESAQTKTIADNEEYKTIINESIQWYHEFFTPSKIEQTESFKTQIKNYNDILTRKYKEKLEPMVGLFMKYIQLQQQALKNLTDNPVNVVMFPDLSEGLHTILSFITKNQTWFYLQVYCASPTLSQGDAIPTTSVIDPEKREKLKYFQNETCFSLYFQCILSYLEVIILHGDFFDDQTIRHSLVQELGGYKFFCDDVWKKIHDRQAIANILEEKISALEMKKTEIKKKIQDYQLYLKTQPTKEQKLAQRAKEKKSAECITLCFCVLVFFFVVVGSIAYAISNYKNNALNPKEPETSDFTPLEFDPSLPNHKNVKKSLTQNVNKRQRRVL